MQLVTLLAAALGFVAVLGAASTAHADESDDGSCPLRGLVTAGASEASLFGIGGAAARVGIGVLGAQARSGVIGGVLFDADFGSTSGGLPIRTFTVSAPILFVAGAFRLGAGPEIAYVTLARHDRTAESIDGAGIGVAGFVGLDLLRTGRERALTVVVRPQLAWLHDARHLLELDHYAISPGAALVLGARF